MSTILEFVSAFCFVIANTYFEKREEHLITNKSGVNRSKIDFSYLGNMTDYLVKTIKLF